MPSLTHPLQYFSRMVSVDALGEHDGKVSRNITNLLFADDIDALAEEEQEQKLETLVDSLVKTCTRYQMDRSWALWQDLNS